MRVTGFHFIISAYEFWLPNDPRGSWSDTIRALHLLRHGDATKVSTMRSLAHDPHDRQRRFAAKRDLRYPSVRLTGLQARAVVRGVAAALADCDYVVHALAILPDHLHIVMAWHARDIQQIARHLKARATRQLNDEGLHPLAAYASRAGRVPTPWSRNFWCPFIRGDDHMRSAIRYVEANPVKAGLKAQRWALVTPFEG